MSCCCEDALAIFKEREGIDSDGKIVRVTIPGVDFHVYYRSERLICNQVNSPIPPYIGPPSKAPKEYYGNGTFEVDKELTSLVRNVILIE